jgi:hypothetical protein
MAFVRDRMWDGENFLPGLSILAMSAIFSSWTRSMGYRPVSEKGKKVENVLYMFVWYSTRKRAVFQY